MTFLLSDGSTPTAIMTGERRGFFWIRAAFFMFSSVVGSSCLEFKISANTSPNLFLPSPVRTKNFHGSVL